MGRSKENIIVIGCSSGGLAALSKLFEALPADYSYPILVVQHREKKEGVLLEEMVQKKTKLKVKQAEEKEKIAGGNIYFAPPDYHMLLERNITISLDMDEYVKYSRPSIDVLFESAAFSNGSKITGIILTGSNNDGTDGIIAIKKAGGKTIAENPSTAWSSYMPQSAINSNCIDKVLTLEEISIYLKSL